MRHRSHSSAEFLLTDLALASLSIPSLTLTTLSLLTPTIETYPPTAIIVPLSLLDTILEIVHEEGEDGGSGSGPTIIVVGDQNRESDEKSRKSGVRILRWDDLVEGGAREEVSGGNVLEGIQPPGEAPFIS